MTTSESAAQIACDLWHQEYVAQLSAGYCETDASDIDDDPYAEPAELGIGHGAIEEPEDVDHRTDLCDLLAGDDGAMIGFGYELLHASQEEEPSTEPERFVDMRVVEARFIGEMMARSFRRPAPRARAVRGGGDLRGIVRGYVNGPDTANETRPTPTPAAPATSRVHVATLSAGIVRVRRSDSSPPAKEAFPDS